MHDQKYFKDSLGFAGMRLPLKAIYGFVCKQLGKAKLLANTILL